MTNKRLMKKRISIFLLVFTMIMQTLTPVIALASEETLKDEISVLNVELIDDEIVIEGIVKGNLKAPAFLIIDEARYEIAIMEDGSFIATKLIEMFKDLKKVQIEFGEEIIDITEQLIVKIGDYFKEEEIVTPDEPIEDPKEDPIEEEPPKEEPEEPIEEEPPKEEPEEPIEEEPPKEEIPEEPIEQEPPKDEEELIEEELEKVPEEIKEEEYIGSNPDNLTGPEKADGSINYGIYPETKFNVQNTSNNFGPMNTSNSPPIIGQDHPQVPGEVMLFKEAKPVSEMVNAWDITLRIESKDSIKTSDIVLVIDRSGSMQGNKMTNAKAAANNFVDTLLGPNAPNRANTSISVVSFAQNVVVNQPLTKDATALKNTINALWASGGTFTQAGMRQAAAILDNSNADMKNIVLLSDGEPTYGYEINAAYRNNTANLERNNSNPVNGGWQTKSDTPQNMFLYNSTTGSGSSMFYRYYNEWGNVNDRWYNIGNHAIAEAGFSKAAGQIVYTIALEAGATGTPILNSMSSPGKNYTAAPGDLSAIFAEIAGEMNSSVIDSSVSDPMGTGFVVENPTNITVSQGNANYVTTTKTINWNIGGTLTNYVPGQPGIRYAQMTYRIEIDDDILGATPVNGTFYPTNKTTTLNYKDSDGNQKTGDFPIPRVDPIIITIGKKVIDSLGNEIPAGDNDGREFEIHVLSENGYDEKYTLNSGQEALMRNLRLVGTYRVTEPNNPTGTPSSVLSDYETTFNNDGGDEYIFNISQGDLDSEIIVTNTEKPLGKLTVKKVFEPLPNTINLLNATIPEFTFKVTGPGGYNVEFNLSPGETKTIENLPYGEYTVTEIDTQGFNPSYDPSNGKVTLAIDAKEGIVTVTNSPKTDDQTTTLTGKKVYVGGSTDSHIQVEMNVFADGILMDPQPAAPTVTPQGTATEFTYVWSGLQKYNSDGTIIKYTINEKVVPENYDDTLSADGLTVTNTFVVQTDGKASANKVWDMSGAGAMYPNPERVDVYFKLFRHTTADTTPVAVPNKDIIKIEKDATNLIVTWTDLDVTDGNGYNYIYTVKEVDSQGNDYTPENFTKVENGLTVTNKIKTLNERDGKLTVKKELIDNKTMTMALAAPIKFTFRVTGPYGFYQEFELSPGESNTLENLYYGEYTVEEIDTQGYVPSYDPTNGEVILSEGTKTKTVNVTNSHTPTDDPNAVEVVARKHWVNGNPQDYDKITLNLYQESSKEGSTKTKLTAEPIRLELSGEPGVSKRFSYTWSNLPKHSPDGYEYIYTVEEESVTGGKLTIGENVYDVIQDGNLITNIFAPKKGAIKANKIWIDGPETKPTVYFRLFRQIGNGTPEVVPEAIVRALLPGMGEIEWENISLQNSEGQLYTFSVKEYIDVGGNVEGAPENFNVSYEGTTVTNKYNPPANKKITVNKIWDISTLDEGLTVIYPTMIFKLYWSTDNDNWEEVPNKDPVEITETNTVAEWTGLESYSLQGEEYFYKVEESFKNEDILNENWVQEIIDGDIRNRLIYNEDPDNPDEKVGSLTIKKVFENEPPTITSLNLLENPQLEFEFKVTGPYGYVKTFTLKAGEEMKLEQLYYGKYKVEETNAHGYEPSYAPGQEVTLSKAESRATIIVTNTNDGSDDTTVSKTIRKIWVNGPKTGATLELWRKGVNLDETLIDIKVGEFVATSEVLSKEFTKLAKHDPSGREYVYYVKETKVPENYTATFNQETLTVTNTYTAPSRDDKVVVGKKSWLGDEKWDKKEYAKPDTWFKLQRKVSNGVWEDVNNSIRKVPGSNEVSWTVPIKNAQGQSYDYRVKEVDRLGKDYVPSGFTKVEDGMIVRNYKKTTTPPTPSYPPWIINPTAPTLNKHDHFGYVIGYPQGDFRQEGTITRGEMTAIFARLLEEKIFLTKDYPLPFSDVARNSWYAEYIGMLTQVGVIAGYPDGTFRPEDPVTRAEFATVASRFIQTKKSGFGGFSDISSDYWAKGSIEAAYAQGWLKGYPDGSFRPEKELSRAETVTIVNRMLDRVADKRYVDTNRRTIVNYIDLNNSHWAYYEIMEASNSHDYERTTNRQERWIRHWRPY